MNIANNHEIYNKLKAEKQHLIIQHCNVIKHDKTVCAQQCMNSSVHQLMISCIDFDIIRQNFYTASNLKDLFHNIHPKCIISFVQATGLTNKL